MRQLIQIGTQCRNVGGLSRGRLSKGRMIALWRALLPAMLMIGLIGTPVVSAFMLEPLARSAQGDSTPTEGRFLYAVNSLSNDVSRYEIQRGAFSAINPVPAGDGPVSVAVDPQGEFVFVANQFSNDVSIFRIEGER